MSIPAYDQMARWDRHVDPYVTDTRRDVGGAQDTPGVHGPYQPIAAMLTGQVDPHDPEIGPLVVVNPREFGTTGWGDPNNQPWQSGATQNVKTVPSAEQGFGVGPERKWPHYPTPDNPNPYRNLNAWQRSGTDTYSTLVYRPEVVAYWAQALGHNLSQAKVKQRSQANPVVNQAPSVPFVNTVPPIRPGGY